ncbi:hypothetical protein SBOR_4703 [Sclerotinia borealis F-4128]|uniref:Alpha-L-rhamnosidase six-hairpin glycosidase domain-containing protein n=1 Tax=Sclerotinia borealis (strain F-4128) TaxID=1432307 RepID=W9CGC7_SCLBF|nr:hypothetical protein SBOR_4703 [Sclerotinia borealis F-4128]
MDITPFLQTGRNVLSARVLRFSAINAAGTSMARTPIPGLILWCAIGEQKLHTNSTWKTTNDQKTALLPSSTWDLRLGPCFLNLNEEVHAGIMLSGWEEVEFDDACWKDSEIRTMKRKMSPMLDSRKLTPRPIPHLPEISRRFDNAITCSNNSSLEDWNKLLQKDSPVKLEASTDTEFDVPKIQILCAESYENDMDAGQPRTKEDRTNSKPGNYMGQLILISVTSPGPNVIMNLSDGAHSDTFGSLTPLVDKLYSTSVNTLLNCMHETHEDCPYYEQNQFSMDTRLQLLYSFTISCSNILARKTIHEFYASHRDDGLLETHFPNPGRSMNIPQFSLYWIFMIEDHSLHFCDFKFVKQYLGTIDGILDHFSDHLNEIGLVGQFEEEGTWPFIDWVKEWFTPARVSSLGVPKAYFETGAATVNSLVYAMALKSASVLCEALLRNDTANEYLDRANAIIRAVNEHCFDSSNGLYLDGPGANCSRKRGIWTCKCIICDIILHVPSRGQSRNLWEVWEELLGPWKMMLDQNLTTWAESESMVSSDCHGWSATPMYEIMREIVGIKYPATNDDERCLTTIVEPKFDLVNQIKGTFVTGEGGSIDVSWENPGSVKLRSSNESRVKLILKGVFYDVKLVTEIDHSVESFLLPFLAISHIIVAVHRPLSIVHQTGLMRGSPSGKYNC